MFRKPKPANQKLTARGDTILSVMISVAIIGSVIGTTYHLISSSLRLGRSGQEREHAINVVNTQVERLKTILDLEPDQDQIFKDHPTNFQTPAGGGFGQRFCLDLNESASAAEVPPRPVIVIRVDPDPDPNDPNSSTDPTRNKLHANCQGERIGFPVRDAEPTVEIRYQAKHQTNINDTNRFEVKVSWTAIGSDRREKSVAYYRLHPLLLGP